MPKLYLVRHAEPGITGVLLGRLDPPLSATGEGMARESLATLDARIVYSSPLRRALETAQLIERAEGVEVLEELTEVGLGAWDGMSWADVELRAPELARRKLDDWFGVTPPGGEPWPAVEKRVARALARIRAGVFPAAVVAHLGINAELARQAAGVDRAAFRQQYCQVEGYDISDR